MKSAVISGTGLMVPSCLITNDELVDSYNEYARQYNLEHAEAIEAGSLKALEPSSAAFIEKASGIKSRYVLSKKFVVDPKVMKACLKPRGPDENSWQCDMALKAAHQAMDKAQKTAADIDLVIVACSNFERPYPAIAVEVQSKLGINQGYAYDMNIACSSATFAINAANNAIKTGDATCVLIVIPEISSGQVNYTDRDSHFIFGDVCAALIVESEETVRVKDAFKIKATRLATQYSTNIWNSGGFLALNNPAAEPTVNAFQQQGRQVFKEVVPMAAEHILAHLNAQGLSAENISRFWLHQANLPMNQLIAKKLLGDRVSDELAPTILHRFANTAAAGSVIAFHEHHTDLRSGDLGILCSFGAGYSVGSVLLQKI